MTLQDKFVQDDTLHNRKRLGPLAWILLFITGLFACACMLGAYLLVTRNVSPLLAAPQASPTPSAQQMTVATVAVSSITATPPIQSSSLITWTVWATQNPMGTTIYDGPPEIKAWVMRDYQAAQKWMMAHLLERDYLLAHLPEYYTDKALEKERYDIQDSFDGPYRIISAPLLYQSRLPAPMDKPIFNTFSSDGMQANLSDFHGPDWKFYDTTTRKVINVKANSETRGYTLEYDPKAKRWKIARLTLNYDLDGDKVTYKDEPFRVITR